MTLEKEEAIRRWPDSAGLITSLAGIAPDELVDPLVWCELVRQWSTFNPEFNWLPRKFKIGIAVPPSNDVDVFSQDLGYIDLPSSAFITPGQIRVCEHVGASIRTFDTTGMSFEKQRDDLFRHWLLGFFSGDLIVRTSGAEKETIRLPNVLRIGWRLEEVQMLLSEKATVVV